MRALTRTRAERTRPSRRRAAAVAIVAVLALVATIPLGAPPADAHTPHDDIVHIAVSPAFARDHTVLTITNSRVLRSRDGGRDFVEMVRGLSGEVPARFAIAPSDPHVVYLSTRGGGVFRSDDQGSSWRPTASTAGIGWTDDIAVAPSSPQVVLAGADLFPGLFRTVDGGASWSTVPGIGKVESLTFVPGRPGRVLLGEHGGAVLRSDDDGATFHPVRPAGDGAVTALAVGSGRAASTVFAGTSSGRILRSDDAGETWAAVGTPRRAQPVNSLLVSPTFATDRTLWASLWDDGVARSVDGGRTWRLTSKGLTSDHQAHEIGSPPFRTLAVTTDRAGRSRLLLAGYDGLFRSSDAGTRWHPVETQSDYVSGLAVSPDLDRDHTLVFNTYLMGVYVSRAGGRTFVASDRGLEHRISEGNKLLPVRRMHNVVFSPAYADDATIFTATWDRFVVSHDRGRSWDQIEVAPPPPGTALRQFVIAVSPAFARDRTIYLGTRQGTVYRSTRAGAAGSWQVVSTLDSRVRSLVASPAFATDHQLFASTEQGIVASRDGGATWTPTGPAGIALLAISPAYPDDHTLFAGTPHGLWATRDGGASWNVVSAPGMDPAARIEAVSVSPAYADDGTLLVSVSGDGLYRSRDGARTFEAAGRDLIAHEHLVADFDNPTSAPIQFSRTFAKDRTVFAFAQESVVRSTDGGDTWTTLRIPPASAFLHGSGDTRSTSDGGLGTAAIAIGAAVALGIAGGALVLRRRRTGHRDGSALGGG
jgi:photosystem II stability/assembly factor-like uncharacterized protein